MQRILSSAVAVVTLIGGLNVVAAQNGGSGRTITPQTAPNPDDPAVRNPNSPSSSNRGDPGSEALNPSTGGPALGQGEEPKGTLGAGSRTVNPEEFKNDPHTLGTKDVPRPDSTRPTLGPTESQSR